MSIYIEGIDFPQDGMVRSISIEADGSVRFFGGSSVVARAVELPPHGDLVDKGELCLSLVHKTFRLLSDYNTAVCCVLSAPTIIPAEPGEEADDGT